MLLAFKTAAEPGRMGKKRASENATKLTVLDSAIFFVNKCSPLLISRVVKQLFLIIFLSVFCLLFPWKSSFLELLTPPFPLLSLYLHLLSCHSFFNKYLISLISVSPLKKNGRNNYFPREL